jgi:hypothetical protein
MITKPPTTDADINEKALETAMRQYIDGSRKYKNGCIVNLLAMIAEYCEIRAEVTECDDWEIARQAVDDCMQKCDLNYRKDN